MKNKVFFILYTAVFVSCCAYFCAASIENRVLIFIFSFMVFFLPLFFSGFHISFLIALVQFFNFFWFRLLFKNINGSMVFIATLSVILLTSLAHGGRVRSKLLRQLYLCVMIIMVFFGAELIIRESPLDKFLDVGERIHNLNLRIDSRSCYIVNHDKGEVFTDSVKRAFSREKEKGVYRIICLGSSSTHGHGAGMESYPVKLEEYLKDKTEKIEVINAGVGGARFYDLCIYFEDILSKLNPDLLIVYFGYNDDSYRSYRYFQDAREIKRRYPFINNAEDLEYALNFKFCSRKLLKLYRWLFSSRLFAVLKFNLNSAMIRYSSGELDGSGEKLFKKGNVRMLVDYCISRSIPVVLIPEVIMYDNREYAGYFNGVKDEMKKVYYYEPERAGLAEYLTDSIHFSKDGYDNLARRIGDFLMEKQIIVYPKDAYGYGI